MFLNFIINIYISFKSKKLFYISYILDFNFIIYLFYFTASNWWYVLFFGLLLIFFMKTESACMKETLLSQPIFNFNLQYINSFFLKIISFFDVQLTSLSYKLFNKILLIILFILSFYWIKINSEKKSFYLKINTFLILITFTPFTLGLIGSARPEFLGIIFVLLSLIFFSCEKNFFFKNFLKIVLSGFFF